MHKFENIGNNCKEREQNNDVQDSETNTKQSKITRTKFVKSKDAENVSDEQKDEKESNSETVVNMEEESSHLDNTNQETKIELTQLTNDNKVLKEQVEKLQRVLYNMNKELTQLKSKK